MSETDQLDLDITDDTALFMTDEQLAARLRQLKNGLLDMRQRAGAMARDVAVIERWLVRAELRGDEVAGADASEVVQAAEPELTEPGSG